MYRNIDSSIYKIFGETTKKWLDSIICPKCKGHSRIDYCLPDFYPEPALICLNCKTVYKIDKLKFKDE